MKRGNRKEKIGGVDWMRYSEEVLKPLFIPWIQGLNKEREESGKEGRVIFL